MDNPGRATRRELLARAVRVGGVGAVAPAVASVLHAAPSLAAEPQKTDADLLYDLLAVELLVVAVYTKVVGSGLLSARGEKVVDELLTHEQAHVRVLTLELSKRGRVPPPRPTSTNVIDGLLAIHHISGGFTKPKTEHDCIHLLLDLESIAAGAYYAAMSKLRDRRLLRTAAEIMASEAQHATVLSQVIHRHDVGTAVPYAFVEGRQ